MSMSDVERLTDGALEAEVLRLATCERRATASLIAHLAELHGRRLHERAGFASLFTYCMEVLRLSEHQSYDRMKAASVSRRYPQVLAWLASGELNLTTVRLLAPHLTPANHDELFAAARGQRKRKVQEMLAALFPQPDVPFSVRQLPVRSPAVAEGCPQPTVPAARPAATPAANVAIPPVNQAMPIANAAVTTALPLRLAIQGRRRP